MLFCWVGVSVNCVIQSRPPVASSQGMAMRNLVLRGLLLILIFVFKPLLAQAADFKMDGVDASCDKLREEVICMAVSLSGKIGQGDLNKLQQMTSRLETATQKGAFKSRVSLVYLDSPGGSVMAAMELGRFIRSKQIATKVVEDDNCASSCVLAFVGGVKRIPAGNVIVHSFYSPDVLGTNDFAKAETMYTQVSETVAAYLKEMRISSQLLEEMMRVPHSSARQLTVEQMLQWGLIGIDPVYAQARKSQ